LFIVFNIVFPPYFRFMPIPMI